LTFINLSKGYEIGHNMWATSGRGKYICQNYIAVRPPSGTPLDPLTSYAVPWFCRRKSPRRARKRRRGRPTSRCASICRRKISCLAKS
jgi:hypothetical protein